MTVAGTSEYILAAIVRGGRWGGGPGKEGWADIRSTPASRKAGRCGTVFFILYRTVCIHYVEMFRFIENAGFD